MRRALWFSLLVPLAATAHSIPGVGDFYAGMLHPLTSLDQLLAMVALSLLAGQQGRRASIRVLALFPLASIAGAAFGCNHAAPPVLAVLDVSIVVITGMLLSWAKSLPDLVTPALGVAAGWIIGWSNGAEIGGNLLSYRFIPGIAVNGLVLMAYGAGLVRRLCAPWAFIAVRVAGSRPLRLESWRLGSSEPRSRDQ